MGIDVIVDDKPLNVSVEVNSRSDGIEQVSHDETLKGNGNDIPLSVNTDILATKEDLNECVKKSDDADNIILGTINVVNESNHPVKITGMAGASATGYQIVDSLGAGDSDFEHYATGDRYGTRIANHNNASDTTASLDLYQSNVGKSVLDASNVDTVLVPTPTTDDNSNKPATTEWVIKLLTEKGLIQ